MVRSPIPKMSGLLPADVREALIAASKVRDPFRRAMAIEQATVSARRRCPKFFQTSQFSTTERSSK